MIFPIYRLAVIVAIAVVVAVASGSLLDRTRLGAMIRAGVDDPDMARVVGIRVSRLFTIVFCARRRHCRLRRRHRRADPVGLSGSRSNTCCRWRWSSSFSAVPGSLLGSVVGSFIIGFIYNFGQALLPELAYFVLFLPMLLVLVLRPQGLFGRRAP